MTNFDNLENKLSELPEKPLETTSSSKKTSSENFI